MRIDDIRDHFNRVDEILKWMDRAENKIDSSSDNLSVIATEIGELADAVEHGEDARGDCTSIATELRIKAREIQDIIEGLDKAL